MKFARQKLKSAQNRPFPAVDLFSETFTPQSNGE